MARAATAGEIVKFRADGNASKLFAIFDVPVVVFTARISATPLTHDMLAELSYDTATGSASSCYYGMTVLISTALPATPANTIGMTYVRKAFSASPLPTGESSEYLPAAGNYLTVLDEFGVWQDHIRVQETGAAFIRYDVAYFDQHTNFDPTPIIGSDRAARLSGATVTLSFSASSAMIDGSTIASHLWVFTGASATSGLTTATPTATYNAVGRYKVKYTVTATNGKSRTTWRDVYVYDDTHLVTIDPILTGCSWDWDTGGVEFGLTVLQDATTSTVRDRTKVLLIEEASYGGVAGSIGPLVGSENIVAIGWLDDETITLDPLRGEISFTAKSAHYWLDRETAFVLGYRNTTTTPASWVDIYGLTPDLAIWDALAWRSTLMNCVDIYLTGDTRQAVELQAPQGSLWAQITAISQDTIFAKPCCDNFGRLFVQIDTALVPSADRSAFPVVMTLTKDDYENASITRVTVPKVSRVDLSGVVAAGTGGSAIFSLSDGHVFNRFGGVVVLDQLLLSDQTQANQLAADYKARENKTYTVDLNGLTNNRLIGICPNQFVALSVDAADTLRGITLPGNYIPRRVEWNHNPETGVFEINLGLDPETTGPLSVNGDIPVVDNTGLTLDPWEPPSFPPFVFSPLTVPPPAIPKPATAWVGNTLAILFQFGKGLYHTSLLNPGVWFSDNAPFTATELTDIVFFELCKASRRAYLASSQSVYSTVLESGIKSTIGNPTLFQSYITDTDKNYTVAAIGCRDDIDNGCAAFVGGSWTSASNRQTNTYLTDTTGTLAWKGRFLEIGAGNMPPRYAIGRMTYYNSKWYASVDGALSLARLRRLNDTLTTYENDLSLGIYTTNVYHTHALAADYIYSQSSNQQYRVTNSGATAASLGEGTRENEDQIACDPTGQYMMMAEGFYATTPKKSSDYGATWTTIATFPAGTVQLGSSRIINLGDANKWVWCYNDVADAYHLKIYMTTDGGTTWTSILGNLATLLPAVTYPKIIRYA